MFEEGDVDDIESNLFASLRPSKTRSKKTPKETESKKLFEIDDDDLLDLLSDGEDDKTMKQRRKINHHTALAESKKNENSVDKHSSLHDDSAIEPAATFLPMDKRTDQIRMHPILKASNNDSIIEHEHKKNSVHFIDQALPIAQSTNEFESDGDIKSNSLTELVHTMASTAGTRGTATTSTAVSDNLLTSSNSMSLPVSTAQVSHSSLPTSVSSLATVNVALNRSDHDDSSKVAVVQSNSFTAKPSLSTATGGQTLLELTTEKSDKALDDALQFGSYIPSNTSRHVSGRRRQSLPIKSDVDNSLLGNVNFLDLPLTTSVGMRTSNIKHSEVFGISSTPKLESEVSRSLANFQESSPKLNTSVSASTPQSSYTTNTQYVLPPAVPKATATPSDQANPTHRLSSTQLHVPVTEAVGKLGFSPRPADNLDKQLRECRAQFEKATQEREQTLSQLLSSKSKLAEIEKEKDTLSNLLDQAKANVEAEKQLRQTEKEIANKQMSSLQKQMEESFQLKEERLKEELCSKHCDEVARLHRKHERSLLYWKDLLSTEENRRRDGIDKLQQGQQKLVESLHSIDDRSIGSLQRLLTDMSDRTQSSLKQMSDFCSNFVTSHSSHQAIEALYDRLAARQKECFHPLVQKIEEHLQVEKFSLSQLERSLLCERKEIGKGRSEMLTQIQQERDSLQKAKEQFICEQQAWLSDKYTEKHHLMRLQTIANETFSRNQKFEMELSCLRASLEQEKNVISLEQAQLLKERKELQQDRSKLNHDRQALVLLEQNLRIQTLKMDKTSQLAKEMHMDGQQALATANRIQNGLHSRLADLQRKEEIIASHQPSHETNTDVPIPCEDYEMKNEACWPRQSSNHDSGNSTRILSQLEHSQSVRDLITKSWEDNERLEEESLFLQQIQVERRSKTPVK